MSPISYLQALQMLHCLCHLLGRNRHKVTVQAQCQQPMSLLCTGPSSGVITSIPKALCDLAECCAIQCNLSTDTEGLQTSEGVSQAGKLTVCQTNGAYAGKCKQLVSQAQPQMAAAAYLQARHSKTYSHKNSRSFTSSSSSPCSACVQAGNKTLVYRYTSAMGAQDQQR